MAFPDLGATPDLESRQVIAFLAPGSEPMEWAGHLDKPLLEERKYGS